MSRVDEAFSLSWSSGIAVIARGRAVDASIRAQKQSVDARAQWYLTRQLLSGIIWRGRWLGGIRAAAEHPDHHVLFSRRPSRQ